MATLPLPYLTSPHLTPTPPHQLMSENASMREKLNFFELALAMESYPSAPPASVAAQIEQQLRQLTAPTTGTHGWGG